ncbi:probable G-protein coupled receptor 139 [Hypanus sabinus]|uniref:probable G-protein coupled receptor 139 n=1 Tax=Hypanus sabinus TaxID=79690 RepID=UPI0028C48EAE|nr:probable G-protein coupled receptor 139 [Hypanus sabinus]
MDRNQRNISRKAAGIQKSIFWPYESLSLYYETLSLDFRVTYVILTIQVIYYPVLAIVAVPVNVLTIVILSRGKCGISKGVTRYLVAMVAADQLVVFFDLVLSKIPMIYMPFEVLHWSYRGPVCNIHAVILYAATDCSVWFTVAFNFDRCVAICFPQLKLNYCTGRAAALVLGTVTLLSCLKNIFLYFTLDGFYSISNMPLLCLESRRFFSDFPSLALQAIRVLPTPIIPFVLILVLNSLTIRHVLLASRARRRVRGSRDVQSPADPEMKNRWQSLLILLLMSGNFILLWALLTLYSIWDTLYVYFETYPPTSLVELGYMFQQLSCCTNTALYAVAQTRFRLQFKESMKSPFRLMTKLARCCHTSINPQ